MEKGAETRYSGAMNAYMLPLSCLIITSASLYLCIKFIFSRQGFFWILPTAISFLLDAYMLDLLIQPSFSRAIPFSIPFFPLVLSVLWLLVVIEFRYAIKKSVAANRYEDERRKNYNEAKYLEKIERRSFLRFQKRKDEEDANSAYVPVLEKKREVKDLPED